MYLLNLEYPFNFNKSCIWIYLGQFYKHLVSYLTLTRVVFELVKFHTSIRCNILFNFNKSCIWILEDDKQWHSYARFNFNKSCIWILSSCRFRIFYTNLTLTRVVFESLKDVPVNVPSSDLTLTRVVFEYQEADPIGKLRKFNFNKSCIWIRYWR